MVQASLSVALGQRAPNRAGVCEDVSQRLSRREDMTSQGMAGHHGKADSRSTHRDAAARASGTDHDRAARPARLTPPTDRDARTRSADQRGGDDGRMHRAAPAHRSRDSRDYRDREINRERPRGHPYERDRSDRHRDDPRLRCSPPRHPIGDRGGMSWRDTENGVQRAPNGYARNAPPSSSVFGRSAADVFGKGGPTITSHHTQASTAVDDYGSIEDAVKIGRRRR
jgi:hypothetical protein